jgi:hypothetical protein
MPAVVAGAGLLSASVAAAAPSRARDVVIENRSSHMIMAVHLSSDRPMATGSRFIGTNEFFVAQNGEKVHSNWLMKKTTGVLVFHKGSVRPQCVFDIDLNLDFGYFHRSGQNLCRDPRIVVTDQEIRLPVIAAAPTAPADDESETADRRPSPPLTPPGAGRWEYVGVSKDGEVKAYLDPDSIVGDAQTRSVTTKTAADGEIIVARERIRCDRWLAAELSEIAYRPDGTQTSSVDHVARGRANDHGIKYDTILDAVAKRVCRP